MLEEVPWPLENVEACDEVEVLLPMAPLPEAIRDAVRFVPQSQPDGLKGFTPLLGLCARSPNQIGGKAVTARDHPISCLLRNAPFRGRSRRGSGALFIRNKSTTPAENVL